MSRLIISNNVDDFSKMIVENSDQNLDPTRLEIDSGRYLDH